MADKQTQTPTQRAYASGQSAAPVVRTAVGQGFDALRSAVGQVAPVATMLPHVLDAGPAVSQFVRGLLGMSDGGKAAAAAPAAPAASVAPAAVPALVARPVQPELRDPTLREASAAGILGLLNSPGVTRADLQLGTGLIPAPYHPKLADVAASQAEAVGQNFFSKQLADIEAQRKSGAIDDAAASKANETAYDQYLKRHAMALGFNPMQTALANMMPDQ